MALEEILAFKDLGIGALSIAIFYMFAKSYRQDFFAQLEEANRRGEESQKRFTTFIENTYKDNTKALQELVTEFKDHNKLKDTAIDMLEKRHDELRREFEEKYEYIRKYHEP